MSVTADDPIVPESSFDTDDEDHPIVDHPLPRVRIRLSRSYFDQDDLWLPSCLSPYIPAREVTLMFTRFQRDYYAKCYPKGNARRVRNGWLDFLRDTDFCRGDMLELVMDYRSASMVHFCVINNDRMWMENARKGFLLRLGLKAPEFKTC